MLLFLPGLICDARVFAPQLAAFAEARAVDGYGPADSLEGMARVALEQAPESFDLLGHSMGARVALEVFRLAPNRAVTERRLPTRRARQRRPRALPTMRVNCARNTRRGGTVA